MLIQHQMLKERGVYTHTHPQHMSPMHCIWLWLPSNGKVWGVTHSLSVVIGAVNLESIYWEWGNQCSKRLLQIKYLPDHGATRQCRRQEMQAWSLGREHPLEKEWWPTPGFLPGQSQGRRSLVGYSPGGHKELGMTKWLSKHACTRYCARMKSASVMGNEVGNVQTRRAPWKWRMPYQRELSNVALRTKHRLGCWHLLGCTISH